MGLEIRRIKNKIRQHFPKQSVVKNVHRKLMLPGKKVILMDTPTNGNFGDQAIVFATKLYMKKVMPDVKVIEIPNAEVNSSLMELKRNDTNFEFMLWNGGGNIGDLYPTAEYARWDAFKVLGNKQLIVFPQSVYFSGKGDFYNKSVDCYLNNKNLFVYLREMKSYQYMKNNFAGVPVSLVPDIVFSLENTFPSLVDLKPNRQGALTLFRSDKEKKVTDTSEYVNKLIKNGWNVHSADTYVPDLYIDNRNRDKLLIDFWNEISNYKLIITDRLHGMIFAYLTKTPAIVFQNNNWKIKSSYDTWLRNADFIEVVDSSISVEEFQMKVDRVLASTTEYIDIAKKLDSLELKLKETMKNGKK